MIETGVLSLCVGSVLLSTPPDARALAIAHDQSKRNGAVKNIYLLWLLAERREINVAWGITCDKQISAYDRASADHCVHW